MSDEVKELRDGAEPESEKAAEDSGSAAQSKRRKSRWLIPGIVIVLLAAAYVSVAMFYRNRFLPNTQINGMDVGNKDGVAVAVSLQQQAQTYKLELLGRNPQAPVAGELETLAVITADDVPLTILDAEAMTAEVLAQQNEWLWPVALFASDEEGYSLACGISYDTELLRDTLAGYEAFQSKNMVAPQDASIGEYSRTTGTYELTADTPGSELDMEAVYAAIDTALQNVTASSDPESAGFDLEAAGCYTEAAVTADDAALLANLETANTWVQTEITYDWNGSEVVLDGAQISEWITFRGSEPVLDEEAVAEYVKTNAKEYDTYGKSRKFVTAKGIELSLPNGGYGWKTDRDTETQELTELIKSGAQEAREPVYSSQGWVKGEDDIGDSYVEIDLTNQHLYLYQDGEIVLESDFVSGNVSNGHTTPAGIFGITYKTRNAVLRGEDYETPVSYWMPFNGDVGMHDATWRASFGGTIYLTNGSHGCVNLPLSSAAKIYEYMETGFPVICYYYPEAAVTETTEAAGTGEAAQGEAAAEGSEAAAQSEGEQAQ